MKFFPKGSLKDFLAIPQVQPKNLAAIPTPGAAARVKAYWNTAKEVSPDQAALEFYCLNHLASLVRANFDENEVLPQWAQNVMTAYVGCLAEQGKRMYAYTFLIIAREARHNSKNSGKDWYEAMPESFRNFLKSIEDSGAESAVNKICDTPPDMPLGDYVQAIVDIFNKGKWGGGYGGKPWGKIAKCLSRMVNGETSLELMIDSAYSLAHNNGPMFNKGMLYSHYSSEFIKILDVQRGGQIPELVISKGLKHLPIPPGLGLLVEQVREALPGVIKSQVDWDDVMAKGSKQKYYSEANAQKAPSTPPPVYTPPKPAKAPPTSWMPKQPVPQPAPILPTIGGKMTSVVGEFQVMPKVTVTMLKRVG